MHLTHYTPHPHHPLPQELCECSPCDKCCMGMFPCAHACARSNHDGSNCCHICLTAPPCLTTNIMRLNYGIGHSQDCCGDILETLFCMWCVNRRNLFEAEMYPVSKVTTARTGVPVLVQNGTFKGLSGMGQYKIGGQMQIGWRAGGIGDCWGGCCSHTFCYSLFFPQCAAARARQYLDGSDCCFNVFASSPCALYYQTRHYYGIRGQCHEDLCIALFCYPCAIDRVYREVFINTSAEIVRGCCNSCCGGVGKVRQKGPQPQGQMGQPQAVQPRPV